MSLSSVSLISSFMGYISSFSGKEGISEERSGILFVVNLYKHSKFCGTYSDVLFLLSTSEYCVFDMFNLSYSICHFYFISEELKLLHLKGF
jgi:hypothetical protein